MEDNNKALLRIGDIVETEVAFIKKSFIQVTMDEMPAIIPFSEYTWRRSCDIKSELKVGDKLQAVVVSQKDGMAMLSVKRLHEDPWKSMNELYNVGMQVKGIVKKVVQYGAFIELNNGAQGLLHRTNITDDSEVNISSLITEGQELDVRIISIEIEARKMSFSIVVA